LATGEPRKCAFIDGRPCNFEADQTSMDFCKVCIEAYRSSGGTQGAEAQTEKVRAKLARLDRLFHSGELEPEDYVRLRKTLLGDDGAEAKPTRKGFHLLLVEKKLFSKQVHTYPAGWSLPPSITGKLVESLYQMCDSAERPTDVRIDVGETKIACLARDGGVLALVVTDDDLSLYDDLITSLGAGLVDAEDWEETLRVAASGQEQSG